MLKTDSVFYTDGSCYPNPGKGGWSFVKVNVDGVIEETQYGKEDHATNNQMELMAIYKVMEYCLSKGITKDIHIHSDSQYCINTLDLWLGNWIKKGRTGFPNESIIRLIHELRQYLDVKFHWVKGHTDNEFNNIVDKLASYKS